MDEGALGMEREGGVAPLPADNDDGGGLLMVLVVGLIPESVVAAATLRQLRVRAIRAMDLFDGCPASLRAHPCHPACVHTGRGVRVTRTWVGQSATET